MEQSAAKNRVPRTAKKKKKKKKTATNTVSLHPLLVEYETKVTIVVIFKIAHYRI
jgi:hypothetical protein